MKLDVVLVSGGLPHHGGTLKERSLGGSETAAIMIAKELAKRGHHVTVGSPCEGGVYDDVNYMPIQAMPNSKCDQRNKNPKNSIECLSVSYCNLG